MPLGGGSAAVGSRCHGSQCGDPAAGASLSLTSAERFNASDRRRSARERPCRRRAAVQRIQAGCCHAVGVPLASTAKNAAMSASFSGEQRRFVNRRSRAVSAAIWSGGAGSSSYSGGSRDDGLQNLPWLQRVAVQVSQSELLRRCLATVVLVLVLRLMCFIPLPGVDMSRVSLTPSGGSFGPDLVTGMWELPVSLGKLGLGPYLTTSIVMSVIAGYAKSQKIMFFEYWRQGGQEGQAKLERLMRALSLLTATWAAWGIARQLRRARAGGVVSSVPGVVVAMAAACMVHVAAADAIKEHGLTDGVSLIIGLSIMSGYVALVVRSWPSLWGAAVPPWFLPAVGAAYLLLALAAVYLTQTELRMPLVHYRMRAQGEMQMSSTFGGSAMGPEGGSVGGDDASPSKAARGSLLSDVNVTNKLPLRVCPGGMMSLLLGNGVIALLGGAVKIVMGRFGGPAHHLATCALMFLSVASIEYFTHKMSDTPVQLSKTLLQMDAGLRGIAPGEETRKHLAALDSKLAVIGGALMGFMGVAAYSFDALCLRWAGVALGTTNVLLISSLAAGSITQVLTLWQEAAATDLTERESTALRLL